MAGLSCMTARWILIIVAWWPVSVLRPENCWVSLLLAAAMLSASSCHHCSITCYTLHTGLLACYTIGIGEAQTLIYYKLSPLGGFGILSVVTFNSFGCRKCLPTWSMERVKSVWYLIMAMPGLLITSVQSARLSHVSCPYPCRCPAQTANHSTQIRGPLW